ncbi:unnamed protein product [Spirodela intermedia]|uniref:VQ domain-containing protein n=1 Tax=Spirodela intermedia TaxID=51605 RepID=A0A7I8KQU5_SPIIN|nr:unnamed protein product [Spirodela intermedia]
MQGYSERYGEVPQASTSYGLHAVRKPPPKPWKKGAAPPIPPRVYRVEPRGFRQLVQRLTGAEPAAPPARRLKEAAPAPLLLPPSQRAAPAALPAEARHHAVAGEEHPPPHSAGKGSPSLYSSYMAWCNLPLLSPGSIAFLDQATVN